MIRPLPSYVLWLSILYVPSISDLDRAFFVLYYNVMDSSVVRRNFFFFFFNVACSVLRVAKILLYTVMTFAIHKNKKDDDIMKWTKLFHMAMDLVTFWRILFEIFSVLIKEGTTKYKIFNRFITMARRRGCFFKICREMRQSWRHFIQRISTLWFKWLTRCSVSPNL